MFDPVKDSLATQERRTWLPELLITEHDLRAMAAAVDCESTGSGLHPLVGFFFTSAEPVLPEGKCLG